MPASALSFDALPGVWPATALADGGVRTLPTGHAPLDAELPGGGWPLGALIELLQPTPDAPFWPLLWPALAAHQRAQGGQVVLVNPPHEPFIPAMAAAGLVAADVLWLQPGTPAAQLWAAEQALRCASIHTVLAWLPKARVPELRRLHLAAAQHARVLLLALRADRAAHNASPALLRLSVASDGPEALRVHILKRRGPPLVTPLQLPAAAPPLRALLAAEQQARTKPAGALVLPFDAARSATTECHATTSLPLLDRPALAA